MTVNYCVHHAVVKAVRERQQFSKSKTKAFVANSLPTMAVNGRYRPDLNAGGTPSMFLRVEQLIDKERSLR